MLSSLPEAHRGPIFPSLPCSEVWSHDWLLANGMWADMIVALSGQSSFRLPTGNQSNSAGHMVKAAGLPSAGSLSIEGPPMTWNIHPGLLYESNKLVLNLSHCIFYLFLQHFSLSYLIQNTSNCFFFISLPSCCIYVPASISKFLSTVSLHCIFCLLLSLLKVSLARALTYEMRYCAHTRIIVIDGSTTLWFITAQGLVLPD